LSPGARRPPLPPDPRVLPNPTRAAHRATLEPEVPGGLRTRGTREWLDALTAAGVPCGPINDLAQVFDEPQVKHRAMRFELPHPLSGTVPQVRNPVVYSRSRLEYRDPPPLLGQHTDDVLQAELGLSGDEIAALRARGVVG
ncbi:MAG: CoA transferase, partial [Pseudomonadota bacterium]